MVQAKAGACIHEGEAKPLPDEPEFNEEARQAIQDVDAGVGVKSYDDAQMFADWGV